MHPFKHFKTITHHRHLVMGLCFKCGLIKQGLLHDLSKYSPIEFNNGAKYYLGYMSPHVNERNTKGYSEAWMHHKGRNKHHVEYWSDFDIKTKFYEPVDVPNRYLAETICDRIAASKNYNKKNYATNMPLLYFEKEGIHLPMSDNTRQRLRFLLVYYKDNGEKALCTYIKKYMRNNLTTIPMEKDS